VVREWVGWKEIRGVQPNLRMHEADAAPFCFLKKKAKVEGARAQSKGCVGMNRADRTICVVCLCIYMNIFA